MHQQYLQQFMPGMPPPQQQQHVTPHNNALLQQQFQQQESELTPERSAAAVREMMRRKLREQRNAKSDDPELSRSTNIRNRLEGRLLKSRCNILSTKLFNPGEQRLTSLGNGSYPPLIIFNINAAILPPLNACSNIINSYKTQPSAQTSDLLLYGRFSHNSGDK